MKEIEVLMGVKSTKEDALKALSIFNFKGVKEVVDIYFYDPLRINLHPDSEGRLSSCYRLRLKDGKATVTYKKDYFDNGGIWTHSDEYETGVDDFDILLQIQYNLGFKELIRIENTKYTYTTDEYEIVLEDVKSLGLYLEAEKLGQVEDNDVLAVKEEIKKFIKTLNINFGEEQNAGKPELMLKKLKSV